MSLKLLDYFELLFINISWLFEVLLLTLSVNLSLFVKLSESAFCKNILLVGLSILYLHIGIVLIDGQSKVGWQGPRCCGPSQELNIGIFL